jgi:predicted nucleotidyltransferase
VCDVLRDALQPLSPRIRLALLYGSIAKGQAHAGSDIDLMIVTDELSLEEIFAAVSPIEAKLGRRISPSLYTCDEFRRRRAQGNAFLDKVLSGETIVLTGSLDAIGGA